MYCKPTRVTVRATAVLPKAVDQECLVEELMRIPV